MIVRLICYIYTKKWDTRNSCLKILIFNYKYVIIQTSEGGLNMIGHKIRERRLELELTQAQLSALTGIKKNTISNYENNISSPSDDNIYKLMETLKCDANYLFEWDEVEDLQLSIYEKKHIKKYRTLDEHGKKVVDSVLDIEYDRYTTELEDEKIPTISIKHSLHKVSAGHGFDLNNEDEWEEIEIPDTPEARKANFALTIKGDSMEPIYKDGEIVLVIEQPSVDIGETGIFIVNGSGFIKKNGGDRLISINSDYDDILFSDGDVISCAGKVIGTV